MSDENLLDSGRFRGRFRRSLDLCGHTGVVSKLLNLVKGGLSEETVRDAITTAMTCAGEESWLSDGLA